MEESLFISYAITACNEFLELDNLLDFIQKNMEEDDEVVVQVDSDKVTSKVLSVLEKYKESFFLEDLDFKVIEFSLNNDFASFKNNLNSNCSKDYIFQIDADEIPSEFLINNIHYILSSNSNIDVFSVPRINVVRGITENHILKWKWSLSKLENMIEAETMSINSEYYKLLNKINFIIYEGEDLNSDDPNGRVVNYYVPIINFPDFQTRIYKNKETIFWAGKVHEVIRSTENIFYANLDPVDYYSLIHIKDISRQENQNKFYEKFNSSN